MNALKAARWLRHDLEILEAHYGLELDRGVGKSLTVLADRLDPVSGLAIERGCRAWDADWYDGKDHTPDGAATWDAVEAILKAALEEDSEYTVTVGPDKA